MARYCITAEELNGEQNMKKKMTLFHSFFSRTLGPQMQIQKLGPRAPKLKVKYISGNK